MAGPATQDHAFVLHTRRYRENSLLLEALTREHGRVAAINCRPSARCSVSGRGAASCIR